MSLTQPSLSQRIRNLESALGRRLFTRHSAGVSLTHDGKELRLLLEQPLDQISCRLEEYLTASKTQRVVISVDHAFGSFWLLPRLPQLREETGSTDICIVSSQDPLNNASMEADITIFMARQSEVPTESTRLLQEQVSAVCSPTFLSLNPDIRKPEDLLHERAKLLHLASPQENTPWLDWPQWLRSLHVGVKQLPAETVFNSYEMVINAARRSQGVALGWHGLIDDLLTEHELVVLFPDIALTEVGYYLSIADTRATPCTTRIRDWILEQAF